MCSPSIMYHKKYHKCENMMQGEKKPKKYHKFYFCGIFQVFFFLGFLVLS